MAEKKATKEIKEAVKEEVKEVKPKKKDMSFNPDEWEIDNTTPLVEKCQYRFCLKYNLSKEKLNMAKQSLNGRRIDRILFNDLAGRYGIFIGKPPVNRGFVADKYNVSTDIIDIAECTLYDILEGDDIRVSYKNYMDGVLKEKEKEIIDHIQTGEDTSVLRN